MRLEFKLPDLAEGMVEGEVVAWLVKPGDTLSAEQPVVEIMTDKATVVIPTPHDGVVLELAYAAGDIVPVGQVLFVLDVADDVVSTQTSTTGVGSGPPVDPEGEAPAGASGAATLEAPTPAAASARVAQPLAGRVARGPGKALATPATRRYARELGVDIGAVTGTGPAGRVTSEDVEAFARGGAPAAPAPTREAPPASAPAPSAAASQPVTAPARPAYRYEAPAGGAPGEEAEERVKIRGMRRAIYEAMTRSKATAAHFTYVDEVECDNLVRARDALKAAAAARGVRLNYLPFIAKAALLALRRFPGINASVDDAAQEVVQKRYYHLGIAAATDAGLAVPVVRHADRLTLLDLAGHIQALGEGAKEGKLRPDQLKGSTFTITSLGKLGGLLATPIINHPEVAILGVHQMQQRAVVRDDQIVARTMMNLSLSFDHRVVDGHVGAAFCGEIKRYLEDPGLMMLEMV